VTERPQLEQRVLELEQLVAKLTERPAQPIVPMAPGLPAPPMGHRDDYYNYWYNVPRSKTRG
jgi:hypothetical protein